MQAIRRQEGGELRYEAVPDAAASSESKSGEEVCMTHHLGASGVDVFLRLHFGEETWEPAFELGIEAMVVAGDPSEQRIYLMRVKWPPNVMSLPHSHPEDRHVTVLSGTWHTGIGEAFEPAESVPLRAGDHMFHPAGKVHWDGTKDEGAIIELVGFGPSAINPVNPGDAQFTRV
jgi:quercetin dioxygenase-like cupin family protein